MGKSKMNSPGTISLVIIFSSLFSTSYCELSQGFIDSTNTVINTIRKRECTLNVTSKNQSLAGKEISIRQIRNHFGFGASLTKKFFTKTDSARYGDAFRTYFDYATPENEMKWATNEDADDYVDYANADWLISWCKLHNIKVRGHNLFWNEKEEWIPGWTRQMDQTGFKTAMKRRIEGAMKHFKGSVVQWDLVNEIVHGDEGEIAIPGMLATRSGDPDVFSWIFKEARAIDPDVLLGVNEFNIIAKTSAAKEYIEMIKKIESQGGKIDIVGAEGHLGDYVERSSYLERIDTLASALTQPIWLTEVDFAIDTLLRADKMEELMRTCFAHPRVGGLVLWIWWEGNRWRDTYTSFLLDSNYTENELGLRWRTVRDSWKTTTSGTVNSDGQFSFKGFQGQYIASIQLENSMYCDTFDLQPGQGTQAIDINLDFSVGVKQRITTTYKPVSFKLDGKTIDFAFPQNADQQFFISTYTLSGKLLSKTPVSIKNGAIITNGISSGCHIIRIGTNEQTLYTGLGVQQR
jgi:GH35 family endo-1,4-beta-xylanase